jgi:hypothetical protein
MYIELLAPLEILARASGSDLYRHSSLITPAMTFGRRRDTPQA